MKAKKKTWIVKIIILFILIIFLVTLIFISSSLDVANQFYQNVTLPFTNFLNKFLGLIPFSLFEFAVATMVILGFYFVISIIIKLCKRQVFKAFNKILSLFLITLFVLDYFIFTQGIGYNTSNLNLSLYQGEVTDTLIYKTTDYYLNLFNSLSETFSRDEDGFIISPYSEKEINDLLNEEYKKHVDLNIYQDDVNCSTLTLSPLFLELHITGVTVSGLGQASVSSMNKDCEYAFVMAHEMAHLKGVAREDEANLLASYILLSSNDPYLLYNGLFSTFNSLLDIYRLTNYSLYEEFVSKLNPEIIYEMNQVSKYYSEHDLLSKVGNFINNLYLVLNGNENGTDDYQDNSTSVDTGENDDDGRPIYTIVEYSPYQLLYFTLYLKK